MYISEYIFFQEGKGEYEKINKSNADACYDAGTGSGRLRQQRSNNEGVCFFRRNCNNQHG